MAVTRTSMVEEITDITTSERHLGCKIDETCG